MRYKILLNLVLAGFLLGLISCSKKDENLEFKINQAPSLRTINGHNYRFEGNKVTELSSDQEDIATYGVITDIHGEVEKARYIAQEFKKRGVDGILIPGDIPKNEQLRYGAKDSKDDKVEIREVLEAIAETGLPIFVIPGNHERRPDYESALRDVTKRYSNIIDMTIYRIFDGDDADLVSLPGYQIKYASGRQFIPDDGYWVTPDFIKDTGKLRKGLDDSVILITHGAGKTVGNNGNIGPATIYGGEDVGDEVTREMQKENEIQFATVGNIHEAGGLASDFNGNLIKQGEFAKQFTVNFGTLERWQYLNGQIYNGMAGIITVKGKLAKYDLLVLK